MAKFQETYKKSQIKTFSSLGICETIFFCILTEWNKLFSLPSDYLESQFPKIVDHDEKINAQHCNTLKDN